MRRIVEKSSTTRNFMSVGGLLMVAWCYSKFGRSLRWLSGRGGPDPTPQTAFCSCPPHLARRCHHRTGFLSTRSSASRFITMMLMRRLSGSPGCVGVQQLAGGQALHAQHARSSGRPPATISRREALARSADSPSCYSRGCRPGRAGHRCGLPASAGWAPRPAPGPVRAAGRAYRVSPRALPLSNIGRLPSSTIWMRRPSLVMSSGSGHPGR